MTTLIAILILGVMSLLFGALLGFASVKFKVESDPLVEQLDALLPQTQCGQCGYPGCKPYAEAVANGEAINKCAPGGDDTIKKIANLMGVEVQPLDESHQQDNTPKVAEFAKTLERVCIETVESGKMTKDLALLISKDAPWLNTQEFLAAIDDNLKQAMA